MLTNPLILASFLSTLFFGIGMPVETTYIFHALAPKAIALRDIIVCLGSLLATNLWNRYGDKLYPYWGILAILEVVCTAIIMAGLFIFPGMETTYFIGMGLVNALIVRNMVCGGNKLRALLFEGKERELFDNYNMMAMSSAVIIGGIVNLLYTPPIWLAFTCIFIGVTVDNILYWRVWKNSQK